MRLPTVHSESWRFAGEILPQIRFVRFDWIKAIRQRAAMASALVIRAYSCQFVGLSGKRTSPTNGTNWHESGATKHAKTTKRDRRADADQKNEISFYSPPTSLRAAQIVNLGSYREEPRMSRMAADQNGKVELAYPRVSATSAVRLFLIPGDGCGWPWNAST